MRFLAIAVIFSAGYFCSLSSPHLRREWTKLILTHHWPTTFCRVEHCKANFSYWTLHGLWPNTGTKCNTSWHFNVSLIEDILPEMEKFWPDLLKPSSPEFWSYEWVKHGTCAAKAESLNSEHKYFSKALELYHKFNLTDVLLMNKIVPSEDYYTLNDVERAITNIYSVKPKIQCVHPGKGGNVQTLGQIEICVDKDFQLINCEKSIEDTLHSDFPAAPVSGQSEFSICDHFMPIYYPPVSGRSQFQVLNFEPSGRSSR